MKFVRAVGVVSLGSLLGHGITALALFGTSRIYQPEDFGVLASFMAIATVLTSIACLRFDYAIAIPRSTKQAARLLILAILVMGGTLAFTFVVSFVVRLYASDVFGSVTSTPYFAFALISYVAFASSQSVIQSWNIRSQNFGSLALGRVAQSTTAAVFQITVGLLVSSPITLIVGVVLGFLVSCAIQIMGIAETIVKPLSVALRSPQALKRQFKLYSRFPYYSTPETLFNTASSQIPVLMIAGISSADAGLLSLATMVILAPLALLGGAVGQVFLSQASKIESPAALQDLTYAVVKRLAMIGIAPILIASVVAPLFFEVAFGKQWERSGEILVWMCPWIFFQLLSSPVSPVLHILRHFRLALLIQVAGLILRVSFVLVAAKIAPTLAPEWYAVSGFIFYVTYLAAIFYALRRSTNIARTQQELL